MLTEQILFVPLILAFKQNNFSEKKTQNSLYGTD